MKWQERTITMGELARLIRAERPVRGTVRHEEGSVDAALDVLAHRIGAEAGLDDDEHYGFIADAVG